MSIKDKIAGWKERRWRRRIEEKVAVDTQTIDIPLPSIAPKWLGRPNIYGPVPHDSAWHITRAEAKRARRRQRNCLLQAAKR